MGLVGADAVNMNSLMDLLLSVSRAAGKIDATHSNDCFGGDLLPLQGYARLIHRYSRIAALVDSGG